MENSGICFQTNLSLSHDTNKDILAPPHANRSLTFCGHQSSMSIYLPFMYLTIKFISYWDLTSSFSASFFVIDKGIVENIMFTPFQHTLPFLEQILVFHCIKMFSYHVQVMKIHHIKLTIAKNNKMRTCIVYDVPGTMSDPILSQQSEYVCSTFQCVLQIYQKRNASLLLLNYSSLQLGQHITAHVCGDTIEVVIPNSTRSINLCVIALSTHPGLHTNTTIAEMTYTSLDWYGTCCKYGGIVAVEQNHEGIPICHNRNSSIAEPRNIYSQNASSVLLLYWYAFYSKVHVTLQVTQTHC